MKWKEFKSYSIQYPNYWHEIGCGYPRTWWLNVKSRTIGCLGYWGMRENPIYRLHYGVGKFYRFLSKFIKV